MPAIKKNRPNKTPITRNLFFTNPRYFACIKMNSWFDGTNFTGKAGSNSLILVPANKRDKLVDYGHQSIYSATFTPFQKAT